MIKFVAIAALLAAGPAIAQAAPAEDHSAHAGHAEAAAKLTIDSPIEALMANPKAKAVVEANMPGVEAHPAYGQFKAMSIKALQPYSQGAITEEQVAKIAAGLAALEG